MGPTFTFMERAIPGKINRDREVLLTACRKAFEAGCKCGAVHLPTCAIPVLQAAIVFAAAKP